MKRRKFIQLSCLSLVAAPIVTSGLQSCSTTHYVSVNKKDGFYPVKRSEFWEIRNEKKINRAFVLISNTEFGFPICLNKIDNDEYIASLMKCTHQGCELTIGGGIYSCPCHGSEFSISGKVLEGPATESLMNFIITTDEEYIYVHEA